MFKLKKYQRKGINTILKKFNGKALLADDMGLGKTLQAMVVINRLSPLKTLIVCPSPLKYNWLDEYAKFFPNEHIYICSGRNPIKEKNKARIYICNYEILQYWRDYFIQKQFKILILDESHYVKNSKSLRYKACKAISNICSYRILLSGTPIENNPAELWSQLQIIDKKLFPSWVLFIKKYNGARRNQWGWELKSATNVKELNLALLKNCMVRRKKTEVLKELSSKIRQVIPIEIENMKEYKEARENILAWIKENTELNLEKTKKAEAIVKLDKLKYISAKGKIKQVCSWINNESPNRKLVVFCYHKDILLRLSERIKNKVVVSSEIRGFERQEQVHSFQNNPKIRVFLTTIRVGGVGLTLTASDTTVFIQQDWNASKHDQAEDRVYRIGQKSDVVNAIYFISKNTIEEKIIKLIDAKRQDTTAIIDGQQVESSELLMNLLKTI